MAKIAIIGAGLSGLQAALALHNLKHDVTVFEAQPHIGGHIQTLRVPFDHQGTQQEAIVDLGVFMFDPVLIHPYLNSLIKEKNLALTPIPLDFTAHINHLFWSTRGFENQSFRNGRILLKILKNNIKKNGWSKGVLKTIPYLQCAWELTRFMRLTKSLSTDPKFKLLSVGDFIKQYHFSDVLLEQWLFPQLQCWWGATRLTLLNSSIQVIADSLFKVSQQTQYTLTQGCDEIINLLSHPIQHLIKSGAPITIIERSADQVIIDNTVFDAVVLATPPSIAVNILKSPDKQETFILNNYQTSETTVYLHTDTHWAPDLEDRATINFIHDKRGPFCTFWVGRLHPLAPNLFLTWGDQLNKKPDPSKTIKITYFLRTLPTLNYVKTNQAIKDLQGHNRTWYCGAHVHALGANTSSLWADNALKSGLQAAESIHQWSLS